MRNLNEICGIDAFLKKNLVQLWFKLRRYYRSLKLTLKCMPDRANLYFDVTYVFSLENAFSQK
jgi:hypothetical protein